MQPEQRCRKGSDVYVSRRDSSEDPTIVLTLAWGCRPAIMLPSMQKAVAANAYHYGPIVISMGRSSEKAFDVSIYQQGSRRQPTAVAEYIALVEIQERIWGIC